MDQARVTETIDIAAAPDDAWALVGDFAGLVAWFPAVADSVVEGSGIGAVRHLTMPDGNRLTERQEARDDAGRSYEYVATAGALPCTDYRSRIAVTPTGSGSRITWTATFKPIADAPVNAVDFIAEVYRAGLARAKALLEKTA
ncbi:SRPBCC family protein [Immundisolibacter sp.]|uniref:SRPBCC family protein n=1 Tax=Immundisolibacter sp. TaxID=1934948 RepID=UPI0026303BB1|nr:SRPBCC family protein [Immundisolibacter sp.]MDD3650553.1 SRPBCC family protein [Immundisolibacter sp.]